MTISSSVWSAQHPNAGQNIQQTEQNELSTSFVMLLQLRDLLKTAVEWKRYGVLSFVAFEDI